MSASQAGRNLKKDNFFAGIIFPGKVLSVLRENVQKSKKK